MSEKMEKQPAVKKEHEGDGGVPISISDLNERYNGVDISSNEALEALAREFELLFANDDFSSKAERAESYRKYTSLQLQIISNLHGTLKEGTVNATSNRIFSYTTTERKRQKDRLVRAMGMLNGVMSDFEGDGQDKARKNLDALNQAIGMFESFDRNVEMVVERLNKDALLFCRLTFGDNEAGVRFEENNTVAGGHIMSVNAFEYKEKPASGTRAYSYTFEVSYTNTGELAYINWPGNGTMAPTRSNDPEGRRWGDILLDVLRGRRVNGYGVELEEYKAGMTEADYVGAESLLSGGSETKISEEARQFLRKENVTFQSHKIREGEGKYVEFFCRMDEDGKVKTLYGDIYQGSVAEIDVMGGELVFSIKRGDKKILVSGGSFGEVMDRYMWEEREINIAYYKAAVSDFRKNDLKTMFRYIHRRFPEFGVDRYFKEKTGEDLNQ